MQRALAVIASFFLVLALAACGDDGTTADANATSGDGSEPVAVAAGEEPEDEPTGTPSDSTPAADAGDGSPLEQLLGAPINDEEAMNRFYEQLEDEAQVLTKECMLQQGFDFPIIERTVAPAEASGLSEYSVEYAERFGFDLAAGFSIERLSQFMGEGDDPLDALMMAMGEAEREAFQNALFGEPTDEEDASDDGFGESWGGGCFGSSYATAFEKSPDRVFDQLGNELMDIISRYDADPRIAESHQAYADCMSEAGYEYANSDQARADFARQLGEIMSEPGYYTDPLPPEERGTIEMDWNGESARIEVVGSTMTNEGLELIDALAEKEFAAAIISAECYAPQRIIELEVQFEYEQILVDELGDQVRAIQAGGN